MKKIIALALGGALLLPALLSAQIRTDRDRRRDQGERIHRAIVDLEHSSDEFRHGLNLALDNGRMASPRQEDRLSHDTAILEEAIDNLRESWRAGRDRARSRRLVELTIEAAQGIQRTLGGHPLRGRIEREWFTLRTDLDMLVEVYGLPRVEWRRWEDDRRGRDRRRDHRHERGWRD